MQKMDPNALFSIFEQGDEQVYKENGVEDTLNNPYVLMGMVLKGLENFSIMDMMYTRRYPDEYKEVKSAIKYKYYSRLYGYLTRINLDNLENIYKIGESFASDRVFIALESLKYYYQRIEYYERCAVIKEYQELLLENLPIKLDI